MHQRKLISPMMCGVTQTLYLIHCKLYKEIYSVGFQQRPHIVIGHTVSYGILNYQVELS